MKSLEPGRRMFDEGPRIHDQISDSFDATDPLERIGVRLREKLSERRKRRLGQAVLPEYTESRAFRLEERRVACEGMRSIIEEMRRVVGQEITPTERVHLENQLTWQSVLLVKAYQRHDKVHMPYATTALQGVLHFVNQDMNPFDGLSQANLLSPAEIIARAETELGYKIEPIQESIDFVSSVVVAQIPEADVQAGTIEITHDR